MVKFFKIIEKIVWIIAALAIAAVLAMVFIGAFANLDKRVCHKSVTHLFFVFFCIF